MVYFSLVSRVSSLIVLLSHRCVWNSGALRKTSQRLPHQTGRHRCRRDRHSDAGPVSRLAGQSGRFLLLNVDVWIMHLHQSKRCRLLMHPVICSPECRFMTRSPSPPAATTRGRQKNAGSPPCQPTATSWLWTSLWTTLTSVSSASAINCVMWWYLCQPADTSYWIFSLLSGYKGFYVDDLTDLWKCFIVTALSPQVRPTLSQALRSPTLWRLTLLSWPETLRSPARSTQRWCRSRLEPDCWWAPSPGKESTIKVISRKENQFPIFSEANVAL